MKQIILTLSTLLFLNFLNAQDYIILKNGDEVKSKVLEINDNNIKYKRFSNQNGPTYTLDKSKVFMIKYESGDKDVFNTAESNKKTTNTKAKKEPQKNQATSVFRQNTEFVYDADLGMAGCSAPKRFSARIHGSNPSRAFIDPNIVYYGLDFTYSKLTNAKKIGGGIMFVEKQIPVINKLINREFLPTRHLKRWLGKKTMTFSNDIYQNYVKMDIDNYVVADNYCLSFQDVEKIVKSYVLRKTEGVGMVINLANLNKPNELASLFVTFFDIATREVIYSVELTGRASGAGWGKHYAVAINDAVRTLFVDRIYKKRYADNSQIPAKIFMD